jgi:ABC-type transport system involved in multi-copper enzyme maturation permease subunit
MSTTLQSLPTQPVPSAPRTPSVVMGRSDYLSVLLRLVAMELYKLRRRALSKVMASISVGAIVLVFAALGIFLATQVNTPATDFAPPLCSATSQSQQVACVKQLPTQKELVIYKQARIKNIASLLILPNVQNTLNTVIIQMSILVITLIIVAGTIVGGDYSFGTIRLLFTRGPTRIQFLLAKVLALAIYSMVGILIMTLVGILLGYALYPLSGLAPDFHFFTAAWLGHTLLIMVIQMLGWLVYATITLFFGILGRSTVAGIVGGIIWLFMELLLNNILPLLASVIGGSIGKFLGAIPDYFISNNISTLIQNQYKAMGNIAPSPLSNLHALLVLAGYLIVCIGLSCLLTNRRDVTH